jgi:FxsC-like protein
VSNPTVDTIYFYLSHSHWPTPDGRWLTQFYEDLRAAVRQRAAPTHGIGEGFMDSLPAGQSREEAIMAALASAHVFVPLYCPEYLERALSLGERASFRHRLQLAGLDVAGEHMQPVLWAPVEPSLMSLPDMERVRQLAAGVATTAPEAARTYLSVGLEEMSRLNIHWPNYRVVVNYLAQVIVDIAENVSLPPTPGLALVPVGEPLHPAATSTLDDLTTPTGTPFVITVIAPVMGGLPPLRIPDTYGYEPWMWRPFGSQLDLPVAEYAADTARGLRMPVRIVDLELAIGAFAECPGMVFLDPWLLLTDERDDLQTALAGLPDTVTVVVLADRNDAQFPDLGSRLVTHLFALLSGGPRHIVAVSDVADFLERIPGLVARTRRRFLRSRRPPDGRRRSRPWDPEPEEDQ